MTRTHRHHDVYDDTNRDHHGRETERHRVPVVRHHHHHSPEAGAVIDPYHDPYHYPHHDMDGAMRRFQEDVDRTFGGWGMGSMFGDRGVMSSFDHMFDDAANMFSSAVANAHGGQGTYYYESKTRTVGPDGRVHEEHVRTTPDEHGNPQTRRTVRDGDSVREMDPFQSGIHHPFGQPYGMIDDSRNNPEVIVEEVDDDDDYARTRHDRNPRRRPRRHHGDVEVEEIHDGEPRQQSTRDWMRQRYRQWRSRN